ncbi:hypothetical protein CO251_04670 [Sulfobacillus sp. hq2]|nr:hypothetical protein CO251_04670 [Sulfobacillus sp. hq2]
MKQMWKVKIGAQGWHLLDGFRIDDTWTGTLVRAHHDPLVVFARGDVAEDLLRGVGDVRVVNVRLVEHSLGLYGLEVTRVERERGCVRA